VMESWRGCGGWGGGYFIVFISVSDGSETIANTP